MRSYPGAFVVRRWLIATLTSATVNFLIGVAGSSLVPSACGLSCLSLPVWCSAEICVQSGLLVCLHFEHHFWPILLQVFWVVGLVFVVVVVVWWLSIVNSQWLQWESGFPSRFVSPAVCNCLVVPSIRLLLYSCLPYLVGTWCVAIVCVTLFGLATVVCVTKNISYVVIHCYFAMSLRLSACISMAPTGQISV